MNEAQTRFNKIDPKLRDAGWGMVPGSNILVILGMLKNRRKLLAV